MLLVHPPVAKPCEPPGGLGRLYGALSRHGIRCGVLDANLEGLLHLLRPEPSRDFQRDSRGDTWDRRALRSLSNHLALLRGPRGYDRIDRYKRAVMDLNHLLELGARPSGVRLGLADYQDNELSPVKSVDLIRSAERPEKNPFYSYFCRRLPEELDRLGASLVGLSLNFLSQALSTFAMMGCLRRERPGLKIVLGGGLVTSWMRRPGWRNPFKGLVDQLIAGPGEVPLLLMNGVKRADIPDHHTPDYGPFPFEDYFAPGAILPYSTSSGCYWNRCSFCPEKAEGNPYVPVPPERAVRDLQRLAIEVRPSMVHFLDNAIPPAFMKKIAAEPLGVPWYGFVRITRDLADPDFCMALKRSGCTLLKIGLESGDQNVLDSLHKGIDLGEASTVFANLKKAGIGTYVYLLFGTPEEGPAEARKTLDFVVDHSDQILFLNVALFNLPTGEPKAHGVAMKRFYEGDLSLYANFEHPAGWHRKQVRQFLDREFKRHPAIASILRRTPPAFTSNHAPFFASPSCGRGTGV